MKGSGEEFLPKVRPLVAGRSRICSSAGLLRGGRKPWGMSGAKGGLWDIRHHGECASWDYSLQATKISFGGLGQSHFLLEKYAVAHRVYWNKEARLGKRWAWRGSCSEVPPGLPSGMNPLLPISLPCQTLSPWALGESAKGPSLGGTAPAHRGWDSMALSWRAPEYWAMQGFLKEWNRERARGDSPEKTHSALVFTL